MTSQNDMIFELAQAEVGTVEWAQGSNPRVVAYYAAAENPSVKDDSVPWCAAFVGAVLAKAGLRGTGSLMARSYVSWGDKVDGLDKAQRGDVVVLSRGSDPKFGHVAFYEGHGGGKVYLLGGNQGDQVSIARYDALRIVAIRRASVPRSAPSQSSTIQASATQVATAVGGGVTAVSALDGTAQIVAIVCCALIGGLALYVMRERIAKWRAGDR